MGHLKTCIFVDTLVTTFVLGLQKDTRSSEVTQGRLLIDGGGYHW